MTLERNPLKNETDSLPVPDPLIREMDDLIESVAKTVFSAPQEALPRLDAALARYNWEVYPAKYARLQQLRGIAHGTLGDVPAAQADFMAALSLAREAGDIYVEAQCLQGLGTVHFSRAEYAAGLEFAYSALARLQEIGHPRSLYQCYNNLASFHGTLGNYPEAAKLLMQALTLAEVSELRPALGILLANLGLIKKECGESNEALAYFDQAIKICREHNELYHRANAYANRANLLRELGRLEEARESAEDAVHCARQVPNAQREVVGLLHLGKILNDMGQLAQAESVLEQALTLATREDIRSFGVVVQHALGVCYLRQKRYAEARSLLETALEATASMGERQEVCNVLLSLVELHEASGDFAQALACHRAYHDAYKTLERQSAQNLLIAEQAKQAVERAQQEAEVHRQRSNELAESNRQKSELLRKLQLQAEEFARLATIDPLTGLYNRRYLNDFLPSELRYAVRNAMPLTVAIGDLDNFKQINDRFSHQVGDIVLKTTAQLILSCCRRSDVVVRYGGEEFLVVLPDTAQPQAVLVCGRIREKIADYPWHTIHPELHVTISIGVTTCSPDTSTMEKLLAQADEHLYDAKQHGKNQVVSDMTHKSVMTAG